MGCFVHAVIRESLLPLRTQHPIRASCVPATQNGQRALPSAMLGLALLLSLCELAGVQPGEYWQMEASLWWAGSTVPRQGWAAGCPGGADVVGPLPAWMAMRPMQPLKLLVPGLHPPNPLALHLLWALAAVDCVLINFCGLADLAIVPVVPLLSLCNASF